MNFLENHLPERTTVEIPVKEWHIKREKELCTWDLNFQKDLLQNDLITKVAAKIMGRIKEEIQESWNPSNELPTVFEPKHLSFNFHPKQLCEELKNELVDKTLFQNQKINTAFWWPRFNKIGNLIANIITNDLRRIEEENTFNNRHLIKFNVTWLNDTSVLFNNQQVNKNLYLDIKFWHENTEVLFNLDLGKTKTLSFDELPQTLENSHPSPKSSVVGDLFEIDLTKSLEEQHRHAKSIKPTKRQEDDYIEIDFTKEEFPPTDISVSHSGIKVNHHTPLVKDNEECKVN